MKEIGITLLGCGTVGSGVCAILLDQGERLRDRVGLDIKIRHVVVRDTSKRRPVDRAVITSDLSKAIGDDRVEIVVELWGGVTEARHAVLESLRNGKNVVTANKALLAEDGVAVFETAWRESRCVAFEAAVGGGIPIVNAVGQCLASNQIRSIAGILNGTSNFILTAMTERAETYDSALREAQRLGFAESDPTMDVDGTDAAQKLSLLTQLGFGCRVPSDRIHRIGIDKLETVDIQFAKELGYVIKLLATAELCDGGLELRTSPTLIPTQTPIADVRGAYNAVVVEGDAVGDTLFYGQGAGQMPTASAVVSDIIDTAIGRAGITFATFEDWMRQQIPVRQVEQIRSRYYLRFQVQDRPGVVAQISKALGDQEISIRSVIQHEPSESAPAGEVPLVIMTHRAAWGQLRRALETIDTLDRVTPPSVWHHVRGDHQA